MNDQKCEATITKHTKIRESLHAINSIEDELSRLLSEITNETGKMKEKISLDCFNNLSSVLQLTPMYLFETTENCMSIIRSIRTSLFEIDEVPKRNG